MLKSELRRFPDISTHSLDMLKTPAASPEMGLLLQSLLDTDFCLTMNTSDDEASIWSKYQKKKFDWKAENLLSTLQDIEKIEWNKTMIRSLYNQN